MYLNVNTKIHSKYNKRHIKFKGIIQCILISMALRCASQLQRHCTVPLNFKDTVCLLIFGSTKFSKYISYIRDTVFKVQRCLESAKAVVLKALITTHGGITYEITYPKLSLQHIKCYTVSCKDCGQSFKDFSCAKCTHLFDVTILFHSLHLILCVELIK